MTDEWEPSYKSYFHCPKCGGENKLDGFITTAGSVCEVDTECIECGYKDVWLYGFYDSEQEKVDER